MNQAEAVLCPTCGAEEPRYLYDEWDASLKGDLVDEAVACSECYINSDCPDECNEPHASPTPDDRGQWTCPATSVVFRCNGEHYDFRYLEWEPDRYNEGSTEIYDCWYWDPYDAGYSHCEVCEEWIHQDDTWYDEESECSYCESCYRASRQADSSRYAVCVSCERSIRGDVHFDSDTEETYCGAHVPSRPHVYAVAA